MKAQLKQVTAFTIELGGVDLGFFRQVSAWEGLVKLQNEAGEALIVVAPGGVKAAISSALGTADEVTVVSASPSLLAAVPAAGVRSAGEGAAA